MTNIKLEKCDTIALSRWLTYVKVGGCRTGLHRRSKNRPRECKGTTRHGQLMLISYDKALWRRGIARTRQRKLKEAREGNDPHETIEKRIRKAIDGR